MNQCDATRIVVLSTLTLLLTPCLAANERSLGRTSLTVEAATVPDPPLALRLLPNFEQLRPGNAAVYYGKVNAEQQMTYGNSEYLTELDEFLELTPKQRLESPGLDTFRNTPGYVMLRTAACCELCDWQLPVRDQSFGSILLPEVQQSRTFARLLAFASDSANPQCINSRHRRNFANRVCAGSKHWSNPRHGFRAGRTVDWKRDAECAGVVDGAARRT